MKKTVYLLSLALCLLLTAQSFLYGQASCPSYSSAFPPPYPATYPCMSALLNIDSYCCNVKFDDYCYTQLKNSCNINTNNCMFEQCKTTGCTSKPMPYCPSPCPSYNTSTPPPGPNPPTTIDGAIFELIWWDGECCSVGWDPLCQSLMDSLNVLVCTDNNPTTADGCHPLLGCTHTPIIANPSVEIRAKVYLQGAYLPSTGLMRTSLRSFNLLPAQQPFNTLPWNYTGTESFSSANAIPNNAVDWVLVELRDPLGTNYNVLGSAAGILLSNGQIRSVADTSQGLTISGIMPNSNYYLAIKPRNHVAVMSATPVYCSMSTAYNFTTDVNQAIKTANSYNLVVVRTLPNLATTITTDSIKTWAIRAGDVNPNGRIEMTALPTSDYFRWRSNAFKIKQYEYADCNMDGYVTYADFNLCYRNNGYQAYPSLQY